MGRVIYRPIARFASVVSSGIFSGSKTRADIGCCGRCGLVEGWALEASRVPVMSSYFSYSTDDLFY